MSAARIGFWLGWMGPLAVLIALASGVELPHRLTREGLLLAGVTWLMAVWWITEALDLAATSLVPLVAFPITGIMGVRELAGSYSDRFVLLLMGGFFIAMAVERWGLHRRLALAALSRIGGSPQRMLVGFMVVTAALSMWISNTATVLMMMPIAAASLRKMGHLLPDDASRAKLDLAVLLGIAYAGSVGGLGTPIGTPPNVILLGQYHDTYPDAAAIGFLPWMIMALPIVVFMLAGIAWYLTHVVAPVRATGAVDSEGLAAERRALGALSTPERRTAIIFGATALLWIFRTSIPLGESGYEIPGWSNLLGLSARVDDSTVAIFGALALFVLPAGTSSRGERLLDWDTAVRIPWGLLLLFGGGIGLAAGFKSTGLSAFVGSQVEVLAQIPPFIAIFLLALGVTFLTEVTSNTATTVILMPILAATADSTSTPPLAFMLPAALSASCAFMLPVATAPNAIVFGTGKVSIADMARTGFAINLYGAVVISIVSWLYGVEFLSG